MNSATEENGTGPAQAGEAKIKMFRNVIRGCALILGVMFFVMPLIQCAQNNSLNASGWEIATSTGDLFSESDEPGNPLAFVLLVAPIALLIVTFASKSFAMSRNVSIAGLLIKIAFMVVATIQMRELDGLFELTGFNWLVLVLYAGLGAFSHYCNMLSRKMH